MKNSDYRRFIGFMIITIVLLFTAFILGRFSLSFILKNELGDIYWGILLPIFAFFIMIILLVAFTTYVASWIYFSKLKGHSRWFGILGIIPVIGPLVLILLKNKLPQEGEGPHVIITSLIGMILPVVILFSALSFVSSLKKEIELLNKDSYISTSKINAVVKGVTHEKK